MVRIVGPEQFGRVPAPSPVQRQPSSAGEQLQSLGDMALKIGKRLQAERQRADDAAYFSFLAENQSAAFQGVYDSHSSAISEGQQPFAEILSPRLADAETALFKQAEERGFRPSEEAKQRAQLQISDAKGRYLSRAVAEENNFRVQRALEQPAQLVRQASLDALNFPDSYADRIDDVLAALEEYEGVVPADKLSELRGKAGPSVAVSAIKGLILSSPEAALSRLRGEEFDRHLDAGQKVTLLSQAQTAVRAVRTKAQAEAKQLVRDEIASIERTGERAGAISDDRLLELFPEDAPRILSEFRDAEEFYQTRETVKLTSPQEDAQFLDSVEPSGAGFEAESRRKDQLRQVLQKKYEELGVGTEKPGDPAGYVLARDPELNDEITSGDPAAVQQAAQMMLETQSRLGVPAGRLRLLSKVQAIGMVAKIQSAPREDRAQMLAGIQQVYGEHYQRVHAEMVRSGLDPDSMVLSSVLDNPIAAQQVATVIEMGDEDIRQGLDTTVVNDIRSGVNVMLKDFFDAFEAGDFTGASAQVSAKYSRVIEKLAINEFRRSGDASEAIENAVNTVIYDNYHVVNTGSAPMGRGIKAYIPRVINGLSIEPGGVEDSARQMQTEAAIRDFSPQTFAPEDAAGTQLERTISTAVNSGFWVTSEDGLGLTLMVPFVGGGALPLVNHRGERFELKFTDAMKQAGTLDAQLRRRGLGRPSGAF